MTSKGNQCELNAKGVDFVELINLLYEKENDIGIITLNRPRVSNALNYDLLRELNQLIDAIAADDKVKAIVVTGGNKVFAAGADIAYMSDKEPFEAEAFAAMNHDTFNKLANLDKPVIAAIAGLALGGGCELALACDIRVASEVCKIGLPEINLGIMPGGGGTQRLSRLVGESWAKQLILTGEPIDADTALFIGLVTKVVPAEFLMEEARKLAAKLASKAPVAIRMAKKSINYGGGVDLASGLLFEQKICSLLFATEDQKEGMKAFLEKRRPVFQGK